MLPARYDDDDDDDLIHRLRSVIFSYACSCRIHTDAMKNRRRKTSLNKIFTSHFIVRVRKGLLKVCV